MSSRWRSRSMPAAAAARRDAARPAAGVFERIGEHWGSLDFVIHSIAFAPRADLHGRIIDCSQAGFLQAMQVSDIQFIEMARLAEPLLNPGGALVTMSYHGADKVVDHYNIMGPVRPRSSPRCATWPTSSARRTSASMPSRPVP